VQHDTEKGVDMEQDPMAEHEPVFPDDVSEEETTVQRIRYLVATTQTQGQRADDFCAVPAGEVVYVAAPCGRGSFPDGTPDPDGPCGCGRAFIGIDSRRGTTTAQILEADFHPFLEAHEESGLTVTFITHNIALRAFPLGTIVERRGDQLQVRQPEALPQSLSDADLRALAYGDEPPGADTADEH